MSGKFALIIGNTEYTDSGLAQLTAPGRDAEDFARVLKDTEIGAFDIVNVLVNEQASSVIEAIDEFFDQKKPDDLLVLYFSGHGIRDEIGSLYLAFKNTIRSRLRSTAVKSDYIKEAMDQSRSKRQVLILDCCNSGAFPQGTKAELGGSMGMTKAFQGYGRFVLTASDATQFAWEGDQVIGETDNSLFTHFLVKGLEGEADSDGDGRITVDELYDYTFDQISRVTPKQTPTKSSSKVEGEIVLRQSTRIENIKPVPLPDDLIAATKSSLPYVREAAVRQLDELLKGKNRGLARSAKNTLEQMTAEDDSYQVRQTAGRALDLGTQKDEGEKLVDEVEVKHKTSEGTGFSTVKEVKKKNLAPETKPVEQKATLKTEKLAKLRSIISQPYFLPFAVTILIIIFVSSISGYYIRQNAASTPIEVPNMSTATDSTVTSPQLTTISIIPSTSHLAKPADVMPELANRIDDVESSGTGPEGRAPYGDSYNLNRFERPFQKDMTYISDMDIHKFGLSQDADWYYISIELIGNNPNNSLGINYGAEIDLDGDGFGDFIIWAHPPYTTSWDTNSVQVFKDSNHDAGGLASNQSDAVFNGNGYDLLIFDGGTGQNNDQDLAWVRFNEGSPASIQFAFKKSMVGSTFVFGVVSDAGLRDLSKFDYNDYFTEADAGSPVRDNNHYPLGSLYAVDNTCWKAYGINSTESVKFCSTIILVQPTADGGQLGGGNNLSCSDVFEQQECEEAGCTCTSVPGPCVCP